jgi:hypothetical protein
MWGRALRVIPRSSRDEWNAQAPLNLMAQAVAGCRSFEALFLVGLLGDVALRKLGVI